MSVELTELTDRVDRIAWHEQTDSELRERSDTTRQPIGVEGELRALGAAVSADLLDALERTDGYLVWALRLAPFVAHGAAAERAARHLDDPNWEVRHWARTLAGQAG